MLSSMHLTASSVSQFMNSSSSIMDSSSVAQQRGRQGHNENQGTSSSIAPSMNNNELSPPKKRARASMIPENVQVPPVLHQPISLQQASFAKSRSCSRQLMKYLHHEGRRPHENCILHWRKFVDEYFACDARRRWCFSSYDDFGNHDDESLPKISVGSWDCRLCGLKTGKGYEATYQVLPRLYQAKFDFDIISEVWHLEMAKEFRLPSGMIVLEHAKAVQESYYQNLRVVREGKLRIIFTPNLKILSWEFCVRKHEIFMPYSKIIHQVKKLLHYADKYNTAVNETSSSGMSVSDLDALRNMFVAAGHQMTRKISLKSFNVLGFPKNYVRCLQVSEIFNSMTDLIDFSISHNKGPIESLQNISQQAVSNRRLPLADVTNKLPVERVKNSSPSTCFPVNSFASNTYLRNIPKPRQNPAPLNPSFIGFNHIEPTRFQGEDPSIAAVPLFEYERRIQYQGNSPSIVADPSFEHEQPLQFRGIGSSSAVDPKWFEHLTSIQFEGSGPSIVPDSSFKHEPPQFRGIASSIAVNPSFEHLQSIPFQYDGPSFVAHPSVGHEQQVQFRDICPSIVVNPSFEHEQSTQFQGSCPIIVEQTIHHMSETNARAEITGDPGTISENWVPVNNIFLNHNRNLDDAFQDSEIRYLWQDFKEEFDIFG